MGQLLVRNVDDDLIRRLKGTGGGTRSLGRGGAPAILECALRPGAESFTERAGRWRRLTAGRETTDSAELIRADRDRDHRP